MRVCERKREREREGEREREIASSRNNPEIPNRFARNKRKKKS